MDLWRNIEKGMMLPEPIIHLTWHDYNADITLGRKKKIKSRSVLAVRAGQHDHFIKIIIYKCH